MDRRIGCDVDIAEIRFDLLEYISLGASQCLRDIWMNPQSRLSNIIELLREATRFSQDLIADGRRRLHPTRAFAVFARSTHRTLERLLHAFAGHDDQTEIVER